MKLGKLQGSNTKTQKIRSEELKKGLDRYKEIDRVLRYQRLPFVPEIIQTELIGQYHNNFLVDYFDINKTRKLISRKYYWRSFRKDVQAYVQDCNIYSAFKAV